MLRIDFPGYSGEGKLEEISWDEFFKGFEDNGLAFLYEEDKNSRFSKLIQREGASKSSRSSRSSGTARSGGTSRSSSTSRSTTSSRSKAGTRK